MKKLLCITMISNVMISGCTVDPHAEENLNRIKVLEAEGKEHQKQISELKTSLEVLKEKSGKECDTINVKLIKNK